MDFCTIDVNVSFRTLGASVITEITRLFSEKLLHAASFYYQIENLNPLPYSSRKVSSAFQKLVIRLKETNCGPVTITLCYRKKTKKFCCIFTYADKSKMHEICKYHEETNSFVFPMGLNIMGENLLDLNVFYEINEIVAKINENMKNRKKCKVS